MKVSILFILFVKCCFAVDFTYFLSHQSQIEVVYENGRPKLFPGGHDEKYYAKDQFGSLYKMRLKNTLPLYAEVGSSIFAEALGLPNLPVYPILLKRGENGVPDSSSAKKLNPSSGFMGRAGSRGEWFSATLQPLAKLKSFNWATLKPVRKSELFNTLLFSYLIGNNDLQFSKGTGGNIVLANDHFSSIDITQSFRFYPDEAKSHQQTFDSYFNEYPSSLFRFWSQDKKVEFLESINLFISKAELFTEENINDIFGSYFLATESFRKSKGQAEMDYVKEILDRVKGVRNLAYEELKERGFDQSLLERLKKPLKLAAPYVFLPRTKLSFQSLPEINNNSALDLLWSYYFQDFYKVRDYALNEWEIELNGKNESDIINYLHKKSEEANKSTYYISPDNSLKTKGSCSDILGLMSTQPKVI